MEEEYLRLEAVDSGTRSSQEIIEQGFEAQGFLDGGISKEHSVVDKLLMGVGRGIMNREAFDLVRVERIFYVTP